MKSKTRPVKTLLSLSTLLVSSLSGCKCKIVANYRLSLTSLFMCYLTRVKWDIVTFCLILSCRLTRLGVGILIYGN
jgi:hypothetical protein